MPVMIEYATSLFKSIVVVAALAICANEAFDLKDKFLPIAEMAVENPDTPKGNVFPGKDGYVFTAPEYKREFFSVIIRTYKTYGELRAVAAEHGMNPVPAKLRAFSITDYDNDLCYIHMMDPKVDYRPEFIGHEMTHCIYGAWHVNNNHNGITTIR